MANEASDVASQVKESGSELGSNGSGASSLISKGTLIPVAATAAAAAAAGLAVTKGPDLARKLKDGAKGEVQELGKQGAEGATSALQEKVQSQGGITGKLMSKVIPGGGGGGGGGGKGGKTRRLPIQRWTDVAVPVERAYELWTNFEEYPKFMHRVLEVKPEDDEKESEDENPKIHWREKIWFSTREWDGEIVDERKNDRIAWKTVSGTTHSGVVSFHRLDKNLTRVLVTVDFVPSGIMEKMASGMRFVKRAVQSDLARFKAYAEFGDAEGLEYKAKPQEAEQIRERSEKDDDKSKDDESEDEPRGQSESDNGSSAADDEERESRQKERESRRRERAESVSSG